MVQVTLNLELSNNLKNDILSECPTPTDWNTLVTTLLKTHFVSKKVNEYVDLVNSERKQVDEQEIIRLTNYYE